MSDPVADPAWHRELSMALPVTPQILLTGNVHDFYLYQREGSGSASWLTDLHAAVLEVNERAENAWMVSWNPVSGFETDPRSADSDAAWDALGVDASTEPTAMALAQALQNLASDNARPHGLLFIDFSSRLLLPGTDVQAMTAVNRLFVVAEQLGYQAQLHAARDRIIWVADAAGSLPTWFTAHASFLRQIEVAMPAKPARRHYAERYLTMLGADSADVAKFATTFVNQTNGLMLKDMKTIFELARNEELTPADIEHASRAFRVGILDNPWMDDQSTKMIRCAYDAITTGKLPDQGERSGEDVRPDEGERSGETEFDAVVYGQDFAVRKSVDVLMRSALNLTAAHKSGHQQRPRGVLFFAGPTGVGKTQLAKAISKLVFGRDDPIVFDMSEFSQEHAQARLLGAPPGYVGHESGGELTSAIRQNPFSVLLFDEIEKAHPRLLDKFLQILEEGRVTDGLGQTVYFSECIIIFTSNLGMRQPKLDAAGQVVKSAHNEVVTEMKRPGDDLDEFRASVIDDIKQNFIEDLGRPELLNRIGEENIVVFDFINAEVAEQILALNIENVRRRVAKEHRVQLDLSGEARQALRDFASAQLEMGGRGIGNAVETALVNPLARVLFEERPTDRCEVTSLENIDGLWHLEARSS